MKKFVKLLGLTLMMVATLAVAVGCGGENNDAVVDDTGKLQAAYEAVKTTYGEDYIPSNPYTEDMLAEMYGINKADVQEFVAEGPMISTHVDFFVGVRAVEGKADAVEAAFNTAREKLISDTMQYPMNIAKINAATVLRHGNNVFFFVLGAYNPNDSATEEEALTFAKAEAQKAVDAIDAVFAK